MSTYRARQLRNNPTPAELLLWRALSQYRPRFTRQLKLDPYYADFACRRARVIVELDGSQHVDNSYDERRTRDLDAAGWRVLRFWNGDVLTNIEGVVTAIIVAAEPRLPPGELFEATAPRAGRDRKPRTRRPPPTPPANAGGES